MSKAKFKAKSKKASRIITGDKELDRKLQKLKVGTANKLARRGMTKALRICAKSIKSQVPAQYKDAKRAIGSVFDKKGKKGQVRAKAGAGVGKAQKAEPKSKHKKGGVGISGRNIHWAILGTKNRKTRKPDKLGRPAHETGTMAAFLPDIVKEGFNSASSQMMSTIQNEVAIGLEKEAAKK